jgi:phospholipid/cholesterol/gamma-HCH transport system permease protein
MNFIGSIGSSTISLFKEILYAFGFFLRIIKEALKFLGRKRIGKKVLIMQILFTGVNALSIVGVIALSFGTVILIQGMSLLPAFGQADLVYPVLIIVITRELGPLLTAFIIVARSGTAIATEIGNMVVSHEIEAYLSFGINPISYIAVPRFLGVTIAMLLLNIYFNIFGLFGSYLVTNLLIQPIELQDYLRGLLGQLKTVDIISSLTKSLVFGVIISTVSIYNGFKVKQSTTEIPQVAIKAVGQGFILCIIANVVITMIYYF